MTDDQHVYWSGYIREMADYMRLRDWDIALDRAAPPPEDHAGADIWVVYGQRRAIIRLNHDLYRKADLDSRIAQRRGIMHELMHCYSEDMREAGRLKIKALEEIGAEISEGDRLFWLSCERGIELLVDGVATWAAEAFALPIGCGNE